MFIHHEPVDSMTTESGLEDEMSDTEETDVQQRIVYKIGKSYKNLSIHCCTKVLEFFRFSRPGKFLKGVVILIEN